MEPQINEATIRMIFFKCGFEKEDGHCFNLSSFVWVKFVAFSINITNLSVHPCWIPVFFEQNYGSAPKATLSDGAVATFKNRTQTNHLNGHFETHVLRYNDEIRRPK